MKKYNLHNGLNKVDSHILLPLLTKEFRRRKAISILSAAIENYAELGLENTTYEAIAKRAKVSRPLIFQYFRDYEDIFYNSVKLIRVHFQEFAVKAMAHEDSPAEKLKSYVRSTFAWQEMHPAFSGTLFLYSQKCGRNERDRDLNTQFHITGRQRLVTLINAGLARKQFKCDDPEAAAEMIQAIIAGGMLTTMSVALSNKKMYQQHILELCLGLLKAKL